MKKYLLLVCALSCIVFAKAKDWTQYVNPLMGSQSSFELSTGNTYPAIARPWGMNFWTPQTGKMGDGWQYTYTANKRSVPVGLPTKEKPPLLIIIKYILQSMM